MLFNMLYVYMFYIYVYLIIIIIQEKFFSPIFLCKQRWNKEMKRNSKFNYPVFNIQWEESPSIWLIAKAILILEETRFAEF